MPQHFPYDVDGRLRPLLRLIGLREDRDGVTVTDDGTYRATLGRFTVQTPISNIASAERTGPYTLMKVAGIRMSMKDRGLTFGTSTAPGVCTTFHHPVDRVVVFRHPGLTVTVADPDGLVAAITQAQGV